MQKWQNTSAGPIQCKRFNQAWSKLNWEDNTYVELTGVVGQSERRTVLTTMGTAGARADVTAAKETVGERFGWTVTRENVGEVVAAVEAALVGLQQSRPVHDERTTPDAEAERRAEQARRETEGRDKADQAARAFVARYGSGERVKVEPGQMAVVAKICFDNSDTMTDYFDRHASLSQSFVLLVVGKQAETERLARRGVAWTRDLAAIEFDWHTEKWSMGHGNYLESKGGFELPEELRGLRNRGGAGGDVTRAHWEISFQHGWRGEGFELDAIAGYGRAVAGRDQVAAGDGGSGSDPETASESASESAAVAPGGVTVTENPERDGLEIRFPSKPAAAVLDRLKAAGWRWSKFSACWYAKRTAEARRFAAELGGQLEASGQAEGEQTGQATEQAAAATAATTPATKAPAPPLNDPPPQPSSRPTARRERIPDDVLDVLRQANFDSDSVQLNGQLDRVLYLKVNQYLDLVGGKWNRGRKCHVFAQDPREVLGLDEGRVKPDGMSEAAIARAVEQGTGGKVIANLFPTPPELAARMVEVAELEPWQRMLEPSAGTGNILRAVPAFVDKVAVELDPRLFRSLLNGGGSGLWVIEGDFLEQNGNLGKFDRVVMNPPFQNGADIKHIRHALTFLKPGGRLVALCANGSRQRAELKPLAENSGGWWEDLPAGTFKEQGTGVNVALLVVEAGE